MAKYEHYHTKFEVGNFYHIYNRSVDRKPMFKNQGNYHYFLRKLFYYLSSHVDIYAYALLNNHFHLLILIQGGAAPIMVKGIPSADVHLIVSKQLRRFFQCYALAFNKQHDRIGTLFQTPFKRALVEQNDLKRVIRYIHTNPQKHDLVTDFKTWKWTSYHLVINRSKTALKRKAVLERFDNEQYYISYHALKKSGEDCELSIE